MKYFPWIYFKMYFIPVMAKLIFLKSLLPSSVSHDHYNMLNLVLNNDCLLPIRIPMKKKMSVCLEKRIENNSKVSKPQSFEWQCIRYKYAWSVIDYDLFWKVGVEPCSYPNTNWRKVLNNVNAPIMTGVPSFWKWLASSLPLVASSDPWL